MARLIDLPQDPFSCILEHLSRNQYHILAQVCRVTNKFAMPYLYGEITIAASRSQACAHKLVLLLRTLLTQPHLASHVSAIRFLGSQPYWNDYNPWLEKENNMKLWGLEKCTALSRAQIIFASNMLYQLVDVDVHHSRIDSSQKTKDTLAILVLTRFSDLRSIELGDGFLKYSQLLPQILKRTDLLFPKLQHLVLGDKRFDMAHSIPYMDLDLIRPVFYSSTIRKFELTMTQPWQFQWNTPKAPRSDSLTTLHLFRTSITRPTLELLLSATPKLHTFHYEQEIHFNKSTPSAPSLSPYLDLEYLNIALSHVKKTLQECKLIIRLAPGSISASQYASCGIAFPAVRGSLFILQDMLQLRKVELPIIMVLGWKPSLTVRLEEVLPACITSLVLRDDLVAYSPWTFRYHCEQKIFRLSEYIEDSEMYTPRLVLLSIRLTSGKRYLQTVLQAMMASITCKGCKLSVQYGGKSETYTWQFDRMDKKTRLGHGVRIDSLLPMYRDGDQRLLRSPVTNFF